MSETPLSTAPLRIASTPDILYAPQFLAQDLGLFAAAGVDVAFEPTPEGYGVVKSGGASHLFLGTIWFAAATAGGPDPLLPIAQSNGACHHTFLARRSLDASLTEQLRGGVLIVPAGAPTPAAVAMACLRRLGVGADEVRIITGNGLADSIELFSQGFGDLLLCPAEVAAVTEWQMVDSVTGVLGLRPWSYYLARQSVLTGPDAPQIAAFVEAFGVGQSRLAAMRPDEVADVLAPRFPNLDRLSERIAGLVEQRVWSATPEIDVPATSLWWDDLVDAGLIPSRTRPIAEIISSGHEALQLGLANTRGGGER